ncbi:MAG: leucine-rich repeat domain-containing protein [Clostridiales bacterium]|nr:leucine-rich repeat domain-containing protein [Clostridiales bacterium]
MKKFVKIISFLLCLILSLAIFPACDNNQVPDEHECLKFIKSANGKEYTVLEKEFCDCAEIIIPSYIEDIKVSAIGEKAFYKCAELTKISIPRTVTSIGQSAFVDCINLKNLTVPSTITTWSAYCFASMGIENLTLETGLKEIGAYSFYYCESLTEVTIPNSVKTIGSSAFSGCSGMSKLTIGSGVTSIESGAFDGCGILQEIFYIGTIENWNKIEKGSAWNWQVPALYVICTDGIVDI